MRSGRCRSIAAPGTRWTGCSTGRQPPRATPTSHLPTLPLHGGGLGASPLGDRSLVDRQVHQRGESAEGDGATPCQVVAAREVEDAAAEPGAEEAADLVA